MDENVMRAAETLAGLMPLKKEPDFWYGLLQISMDEMPGCRLSDAEINVAYNVCVIGKERGNAEWVSACIRAMETMRGSKMTVWELVVLYLHLSIHAERAREEEKR